MKQKEIKQLVMSVIIYYPSLGFQFKAMGYKESYMAMITVWGGGLVKYSYEECMQTLEYFKEHEPSEYAPSLPIFVEKVKYLKQLKEGKVEKLKPTPEQVFSYLRVLARTKGEAGKKILKNLPSNDLRWQLGSMFYDRVCNEDISNHAFLLKDLKEAYKSLEQREKQGISQKEATNFLSSVAPQLKLVQGETK